MNGEYEIDEHTFRGMEVSEQNWILFQTFNAKREECEGRFCEIEKEHTKLCVKVDRRKKVDTSLGIGSGVVGGLIGYFMKALVFK